MYDTRWPRPGPALAALCAAAGLVVGVALGFTVGGGRRAEAHGAAATASAPTTSRLPGDFWTVVLASPADEAGARAKADALRGQGVADAAVLRQADYASLRAPFAVVSGQLPSMAAAAAHQRELAAHGVTGGYLKHVQR
jgi:hypothetical protein